MAEMDMVDTDDDIFEVPAKRPYCRFKYSLDELNKAIQEVKSGRLAANKASKIYSIPKGTLMNKLHANEPLKRKMGPSSILTEVEEKRMENWILGKAKLGFPMHQEEVFDTVQKVMQETKRENPFKDNRPGRTWLNLFLKRNPEISIKNAETISKARACVTESAIRDWFKGLKDYLIEESAEDILEDPKRILNLDETGVSTCPKTGKLLGPKHYKNFYEVAPGPEKECITVLCSYSADGNTVTPMIVYPYKRIPRDVVESVPESFAIGRSDSGWMIGATFYEYIANVLYPFLVQEKYKFPVLLLLDGHKSHINEELYSFCKEKKIFVYCLLPNATHILQPCDVAIFKPLKNAWRKEVRRFKQRNSKAISKQNFAPLFYRALKAVTTETIKNGFKACGLYPFEADVVDYNKCISKRREELDLTVSENSIPKKDCKTALNVIQTVLGIETAEFFREVSSKGGKPADPEQSLMFEVWKTLSQMHPEDEDKNLPAYEDVNLQNGKSTEDGNVKRPLNKKQETDLCDVQMEVPQQIVHSLSEEATPLQDPMFQKPSTSADPWASHMHWPEVPEKKQKKCNGEKMPFAITSKKWKEYIDMKNKIKIEKEEGVKKRKADRATKKEEEEHEKIRKKEDRKNFQMWLEKKNKEIKEKLEKYKYN